MMLEHLRNQFEREYFKSHSVLISMPHRTTHADVTRVHTYKQSMFHSQSVVDVHPIYYLEYIIRVYLQFLSSLLKDVSSTEKHFVCLLTLSI